jgi:glutathione S-transferase
MIPRGYRLHGFCQSGNTYKVAFLLRALNQPWQAEFVDYMNGVTRTGEWREAANPMAVAPDPAVMSWLRGRLDSSFGIVDAHLATRRFMVGNAPTIADISLCGYLFFPLAESGYEIAGRYPAIDAWRSRMREIPGWADPYEILPGERIEPRW